MYKYVLNLYKLEEYSVLLDFKKVILRFVKLMVYVCYIDNFVVNLF